MIIFFIMRRYYRNKIKIFLKIFIVFYYNLSIKTGVYGPHITRKINEKENNYVFPCNEIKKTAWDVLKNFDHAMVLREDDPLLPAILPVYEEQGIRNGALSNKM